MSFKITWNADSIIRDLQACTHQVNNAYNDGFVSWGCKQDLYRVKYALDEMLSRSVRFAGEDEWIQKLEAERSWKILKQGL